MPHEPDRLPAEFERLERPSPIYAPRQVVTYWCPREHVVSVPFAMEADVPEAWECRCGQMASRLSDEEAVAHEQG